MAQNKFDVVSRELAYDDQEGGPRNEVIRARKLSRRDAKNVAEVFDNDVPGYMRDYVYHTIIKHGAHHA